jgi:hypothetical protein
LGRSTRLSSDSDSDSASANVIAMTTVILVATLFTLTVDTGQDVATVVHVAKVVRHRALAPVYHHLLKPVGKTVEKGIKKG